MDGYDWTTELHTALASEEGQADPQGIVRAWLKLFTGEESPDTRWGLVPELGDREELALSMAKRDGTITSGELAKAAYVGTEAARLTLRTMTEKGLLLPEGDCRGRVYRVV